MVKKRFFAITMLPCLALALLLAPAALGLSNREVYKMHKMCRTIS